MKKRAVVTGGLAAGIALILAAYVHAQGMGQSLPPKLGQAPTPPSQNQQPRLRVLTSPSVASPMLLLPESGAHNVNSGLTESGTTIDQPAPQSGSENLYPKSMPQPPAKTGSPGNADRSTTRGPSVSAQGHNAFNNNPSYDPRPFLTAMLELRLMANTCEQYLPISPDDATKQVEDFFTNLRRPVPTGTLKDLGRSLDLLIRSQAASVCQNRMNKALGTYQMEARVYDGKKPNAWPAAPIIKATNWCSTPNCIEVK